MSPEGCRAPTQAPPVSVLTVPPKGARDTGPTVKRSQVNQPPALCHHNTAGRAQHPEVGNSPGTSAPRLISIIADEGLRPGLR